MHELSIARSVIELACEHLKSFGDALAPPSRVRAVHLAIGDLSCVHEDSLRFSFELAAEGTPLEGAQLVLRRVPVVIYCPTCLDEVTLPGIQSFRCPVCATPSADIRSGRELDLESLELEEEPLLPHGMSYV